jgi:hypothetical protein
MSKIKRNIHNDNFTVTTWGDGSSGKYMLFVFDTDIDKFISVMDFPTAKDRDEFWVEVKRIPDCPPKRKIYRGSINIWTEVATMY